MEITVDKAQIEACRALLLGCADKGDPSFIVTRHAINELCDQALPPEALRSERECPTCGAYEGDHLYCKTCGSCGEDGCCPPEKCQKARRDETIEECAALAEAQSFPFGEDYMSALQIAQAIRALKTTPSPRGKQ